MKCDLATWSLPDAVRMERFLSTWEAYKRGGFKATQETLDNLAFLYGLEPPELDPCTGDESALAACWERFLAAWEAYKRAGFKITQEAVNELAEMYGVKPPELE